MSDDVVLMPAALSMDGECHCDDDDHWCWACEAKARADKPPVEYQPLGDGGNLTEPLPPQDQALAYLEGALNRACSRLAEAQNDVCRLEQAVAAMKAARQ